MKHRHCILLLPFVIILCSCRSIIRSDVSTDLSIDTTIVRYVERIVKDTIEVQLPSEHISTIATTDTSVLHTTFAQSAAWIDTAGLLHHTLENLTNTLPVVIDKVEVVRDSIVYRDRIITKSQVATKKGIEPGATFIIGFCMAILLVALFLRFCRR